MDKNGYLFRFLRLMLGLFFCGTGCYITIQANIGLAPWDALNMGFANVTGMSYGDAGAAVGFMILVLVFLLKEKIGFGTILNAILYPKWVDVWNYFGLIPKMNSLISGIPLMLFGQVIICVGTWLYMGCAMGSGPRDSLMVGVGKRARNMPIGLVRGSLEAMAVLGGWLMGAKIGFGTLMAVFSIGIILQAVFGIVHFEARSIKHESCLDTLKKFKAAVLDRNTYN